MSNLVEQIKTAVMGTSTEVREKVNKNLNGLITMAEIIPAYIFVTDALNGEFNVYAAPFAIDGYTRSIRYISGLIRDIVNDPSIEHYAVSTGIIGTGRELKQRYL